MAVRRVEAERTTGQGMGIASAVWAVLLALAILVSPLLYDAWRLFGGS
ncbi:MAG: hypothetical protein ACYC3S_13685 [Chloroflexota bacterium]